MFSTAPPFGHAFPCRQVLEQSANRQHAKCTTRSNGFLLRRVSVTQNLVTVVSGVGKPAAEARMAVTFRFRDFVRGSCTLKAGFWGRPSELEA